MKKYDTSLLRSCGDDVVISDLVSIVRPELVKIGSHVAIDPWLHCTTAVEIANHVHISSHVGIIGGKGGLLKMGNFTNISVGGRIICVSDRFNGDGLIGAVIPDEFLDSRKSGPVVFESFANIGANVTIFPGVTLGEGSVVGACSMVTEDTEPWTIYVGCPARPIKVRPKEKMLKYASKFGF